MCLDGSLGAIKKILVFICRIFFACDDLLSIQSSARGSIVYTLKDTDCCRRPLAAEQSGHIRVVAFG